MRLQHCVRVCQSIGIVAALLCASCAGLKTPYPDKAYFAIEPGTPTPQPDRVAPTSAPSDMPVILIRHLTVASPYDEPLFVYKTGPAKFETDYYNAFIAEPASLLTDALVKWLSTEQPLGSILPGGSGARHDLSLEGNITALYADLQKKDAPRAVIEARFLLIDERKRDSVVFEKAYSASVPADSAAPASLAAALGRAYRQLLQSLNDDLSARH